MPGDRLHVLALHSPLVGPPSLVPLVATLAARGHVVELPDLTGVAEQPRPTWMIDAAIAAADGVQVDVVLAHSGAGAILPVVASAVGAAAAVFVDAVLPAPTDDRFVHDEAMRDALAVHTAADGRLRPWLEWWDDDVVRALLPDPVDRAMIAAACPRLPISFYDHDVPLPATWVPGAYVALGGGYPDELARAADLGWPCRSLGLAHLATVTHPAAVAEVVLEVVGELGSATPTEG